MHAQAFHQRNILHMDLDAFFAECEALKNPSLRGRPLVVVGSMGDRSVVASCSYEARSFGVRSAMPGRMARQLCPDAIFLRGDMEYYSAKSREVREVVAQSVPLYEFASIDEFYCDLTGMDRFFGVAAFATEFRQRLIKETGLPVSMALSTSKTVSKIGTREAKPNGELHVAAGREKSFLAPLPVSRIPMVGPKAHELLSGLGIRRIQTLQATSPQLLRGVLGSAGPVLWRKANGLCAAPVQPYHEQKSLGTEQTFHDDITDPHFLHAALVALAEGACFDLRRGGFLAGCITLKLRYADFNTHTRQQRIAYTHHDREVLAVAKTLLARLWERRQRVRLLGVRFSELVRGSQQPDLFADAAQDLRLLAAVDRLRHKHGARAVVRAAGLGKRRR